jgi:hypothetical protein
MKNFIITEKYNTNSINLIQCMLSDDYYKYIKEELNEINNYKFNYVKYDISNNLIFTNVEYNIILQLPNWVKKLVNYNEYYTIETTKYDLLNNHVKVDVTFPKLPMNHLIDLSYHYKVNDISNNMCEKSYTFNINCQIPVLKIQIEKMIKNIILQKNKLKFNITTSYLNKNKNKKDTDDIKCETINNDKI